MAKTYMGPGEVLEYAAPTGGVTAGTPILQGTKVVIPLVTADEAATFTAAWCGEHKVTKAGSQEWTVGAAVYWDDTGKAFTTSASGTTAAGFATRYVGNGSGATTGYVMLNGVPG